MSACFSAAASFTASPVIATISPCSCISRARRSLSSRRDAAEHVQLRAAGATSSSSDSACSSLPLIAPGPSPSVSPIACAVTAWSPVIMRTSMPAPSAVCDGALRLGAQRVDDPDHADERRGRWSSDIGSAAIAPSSSSLDEAGGEREHAQALARPSASFAASMPGARLVDRHLRAAQRPAGRRAAREHDVGAALDELDHALAARRASTRWKVAMNL